METYLFRKKKGGNCCCPCTTYVLLTKNGHGNETDLGAFVCACRGNLSKEAVINSFRQKGFNEGDSIYIV